MLWEELKGVDEREGQGELRWTQIHLQALARSGHKENWRPAFKWKTSLTLVKFVYDRRLMVNACTHGTSSPDLT